MLLPSTGLNVSLDRACCKVLGRNDAQPARVRNISVEEEGEKGGRKRSGRSHTDRAGHGNRPVMIPTCAKGLLAAIKGLLGAVGLSETAPSVWPLPCPGFRPARLGNALIPCSAAALLSTLLAPCTTQTVDQANILAQFWTMHATARYQADLNAVPAPAWCRGICRLSQTGVGSSDTHSTVLLTVALLSY